MLDALEQTSRTAWEKNLDTHRLLWPDTEIVRFLGHAIPRGQRSGLRALDIGCGGGRHLACLAREGFEVFGLDYNLNALQQAGEAVRSEGKPSRMMLADVVNLPIGSEQFDLVLAWGLLFATTLDRSLSMMRRVREILRPGGRLLANWRTHVDDLRKTGKKVEGKTYVLGEKADAFSLSGTLYSFLNRKDVERLYARSGLTIDNIERRDLWINNLSVHCSWWIVWASRPRT